MNNRLRTYFFLLFPPVALFIFVLLAIWFNLQINIDYTNGNGSQALENAKTMIEAQTVPTLINGISTVTSLLIGLGGTSVGLLFRNFFEQTSREKGFFLLVFLLLFFAFSGAFLYLAYLQLSMGGLGFLETAWKDAITAMVIALFAIVYILLIFMILNQSKSIENSSQIHPADQQNDSEKLVKPHN